MRNVDARIIDKQNIDIRKYRSFYPHTIVLTLVITLTLTLSHSGKYASYKISSINCESAMTKE
jgi:hypothetical protein